MKGLSCQEKYFAFYDFLNMDLKDSILSMGIKNAFDYVYASS